MMLAFHGGWSFLCACDMLSVSVAEERDLMQTLGSGSSGVPGAGAVGRCPLQEL